MDALRRTEGAEISGHTEGTTGHLKMYGHRSTLHWISLVGLENSVRLNGGPMKQGAALLAPAAVGAEVTQLGTGAAVREWWWLLGFAGSAA